MTDSLAAALAELQATPPRIRKRSRGQVGTREITYADLATVMDALRPRLDKLGLLWTTRPTISADLGFHLVCTLTHIETGEDMVGYYPLGDGNPQQMGSALTYARRYALVAMTGLIPEGDDDDGHAASQEPRRQPGRQPGRTRTRIPGPEHERLRQGTAQGRVDGVERLSGPDPDDPWAADGNAEPAERQPGSGKLLMRKLQAAFTDAGIKDRDVRLGMVAEIIGRPVTSANDLTYVEAEEVLMYMAAHQAQEFTS